MVPDTVRKEVQNIPAHGQPASATGMEKKHSTIYFPNISISINTFSFSLFYLRLHTLVIDNSSTKVAACIAYNRFLAPDISPLAGAMRVTGRI